MTLTAARWFRAPGAPEGRRYPRKAAALRDFLRDDFVMYSFGSHKNIFFAHGRARLAGRGPQGARAGEGFR
jgi:hypothetical protein